MSENNTNNSINNSIKNTNEKNNESPNENLSEKVIDDLEEPKMYKVLLLNDDFTPMDFVVDVLMHFFSKSEIEAQKIMLDVHQKGSGVAGVYTFELAEMKVHQVNSHARLNKHPLKCIYEEVPC